ncbi:MAG: GvpL/GvpF family gas vesicle protein [Candidatus Margulisiibacteriota bacterium]
MDKEGKYIYCIIETNFPCNFGSIGIGGRGDEVTTISCEGLSAVVSNTPMTKYTLSRDNLIAHEKAIEKVMQEFTVLPVRFCSIAESADEIRNLLGKRHSEFKSLLRDMDGKVELGLKAFWKDMKVIYKEIANSPEVSAKKKKGASGLEEQIEAGKLVERLLEKKKEEEGEEILTHLRHSAYNIALGKLLTENMFLNAAFLVDKAREMEFDTLVDELDKKYSAKGGRAQFKYVGPLPPYNFVNVVIKEDE